jgi:nucleotide-binding universal stress UspA family protein
MTIILGTDLSSSAERASVVAARLARAKKERLCLLMATPPWAGAGLQNPDDLLRTATATLERAAVGLRDFDANVTVRAELDKPEDALLRGIESEGAELLVVGATGAGEGPARRVGTRADRVAQLARVPTMVVRTERPFVEWLEKKRALRVIVALDFDAPSDAAWAWACDLARLGPIELIGLHAYWPGDELHRLGLEGVRSYLDPDPEVEKHLLAELLARFPHSAPQTTFGTRLTLGRMSDSIVLAAHEMRPDLIVVGTHRKSAVKRFWDGSVARAVLHESDASVVCVPAKRAAVAQLPRVDSILAATDFSPEGDAAVREAMALAGPGTTLHLTHVLVHLPRNPVAARDILVPSPENERERLEAARRLRDLANDIPLSHGVSVRVDVVESDDAAKAICQAADRLGAKLVCVGPSRRARVAEAVLGSVSTRVMRDCRVPVLVGRAPKL